MSDDRTMTLSDCLLELSINDSATRNPMGLAGELLSHVAPSAMNVLAAWDLFSIWGMAEDETTWDDGLVIRDAQGTEILRAELRSAEPSVSEQILVRYSDTSLDAVLVRGSGRLSGNIVETRKMASLLLALYFAWDIVDDALLLPEHLQERELADLAKQVELDKERFRSLVQCRFATAEAVGHG